MTSLSHFTAPARLPVGDRRTLPLDHDGQLVVHQLGHSTSSRAEITMFASLGRESSDFNELALALADEGFAVSLVEGPHIYDAQPSLAAPTLFDLADDVAVYLQTRAKPVFVLGHAFGNRLARAVAAKHSERTRGVILVAAGGLKPIAPNAGKALMACFNTELTQAEHAAAVRYAFFADDKEIPDYWLRGWHPQAARVQRQATQSVETESWWAAGDRPMLVIAATQDRIAPPEDTVDLLQSQFQERVDAVRINHAGHALLPEQPDKIAAAVVDWLNHQIGELT